MIMKITKMVLSIICCIGLSFSFSANTIVESEIYYQEEDITVIFDVGSVLSAEQKQFIADKIVTGEDIVADGVSTYALCWLTGHDIVNEVVSVIEHKVSETNPRCKKDTYDVASCTKCDHLEYTLISSTMTLCCPVE